MTLLYLSQNVTYVTMPEKKLSLNLEKNKNVIEIDFMILKMVS